MKGIDKTNLSISVWKGEIEIKTVDINPDILKKYNMPARMAYGKIDRLLLKVPWNNMKKESVELYIDNISMILALEDINEWYSNRSYQEYCSLLIENIKYEIKQKFEEMGDTNQNISFYEQIFDNIIIDIKNIHVRIESNIKQVYAFGCALKDIKIRSVDGENNPIFIKRTNIYDKVNKHIIFNNLTFYHDNSIIHEKDINLIHYYFNSHASTSTSDRNLNTILEINIDIILIYTPYNKNNKDSSIPIYKLHTNIHNIIINLNTITIRDITDMIEYNSIYKKNKYTYIDRQKYNYMKPLKAIREASNPAEKKILIRNWFRFALKSITIEKRCNTSKLISDYRRNCAEHD